jgi:hypothetical protein
MRSVGFNKNELKIKTIWDEKKNKRQGIYTEPPKEDFG